MILALGDLFYRSGSLLAAVDSSHIGAAVTAMVMSGMVVIGLVLRPRLGCCA